MVPLARDWVLTANFLDASGVSAGERLCLLKVLHYAWTINSHFSFPYLNSWPSCLLCKLWTSLYCYWMIPVSMRRPHCEHYSFPQKETGLKILKCIVTKAKNKRSNYQCRIIPTRHCFMSALPELRNKSWGVLILFPAPVKGYNLQ